MLTQCREGRPGGPRLALQHFSCLSAHLPQLHCVVHLCGPTRRSVKYSCDSAPCIMLRPKKPGFQEASQAHCLCVLVYLDTYMELG